MITSSRCRDLAAEIVYDGYDPVEASVSNLFVEAVVVNGVVARTYTDHCLKHAGTDSGHFIGTKVASYGALCHNTGNLINRNIYGGMLGCACDTHQTAEKCTCKAKPLLDDNGNYSLEKLRSRDSDWYTDIMGGIEWEILDCRIDIEDPDAAHIISVALNRKNSSALVTGHLEIMRTLVALCEPDPKKCFAVPFEPVKKKLFALFGSVVDLRGFVKHTSWC